MSAFLVCRKIKPHAANPTATTAIKNQIGPSACIYNGNGEKAAQTSGGVLRQPCPEALLKPQSTSDLSESSIPRKLQIVVTENSKNSFGAS